MYSTLLFSFSSAFIILYAYMNNFVLFIPSAYVSLTFTEMELL